MKLVSVTDVLIAYPTPIQKTFGGLDWRKGSGQNISHCCKSSPEPLLSLLPLSYAEYELGTAELEAQVVDSQYNPLNLRRACNREDHCSM